MLIQTILSLFLLFAISRVVFQARSAQLTIGGFLFWSGLFVFALAGVLEPNITAYVAKLLGIGRGADVVIYVSIVLLFSMIFRLSISQEETKREITTLIRIIALKKRPNRVKQPKTTKRSA